MYRKFKKYFIAFSLIGILSISTISAASVVCQNKVGTGHGTYSANCSGVYVKMIGYYSDSSERYYVANYTGNNSDRYKNSAGVYAGKRNNSHNWNVGMLEWHLVVMHIFIHIQLI